MGRMLNVRAFLRRYLPAESLIRSFQTQMMAKASHDTMVKANPDRRPFVLTRSGNIGTFHYAASTWSGDNVGRAESCFRDLH